MSQKPREFWIDFDINLYGTVYTEPVDGLSDGHIHVIEYSAFEKALRYGEFQLNKRVESDKTLAQLQKELEESKEMLRECESTLNSIADNKIGPPYEFSCEEMQTEAKDMLAKLRGRK